jgi:Fe-S-cluster-containing hydrogenase component 2
MAHVLMIHADKCTGCHNCALACAMTHEQSFRLPAARVHVCTWEREGFSVPMMCQHCSDAPCSAPRTR